MLLDHASAVSYLKYVQILAFSVFIVYYLSVFHEPIFANAVQYPPESDTRDLRSTSFHYMMNLHPISLNGTAFTCINGIANVKRRGYISLVQGRSQEGLLGCP